MTLVWKNTWVQMVKEEKEESINAMLVKQKELRVVDQVLGLAASAAAGLGLKKMLEQQKKGGSVKKMSKKK